MNPNFIICFVLNHGHLILLYPGHTKYVRGYIAFVIPSICWVVCLFIHQYMGCPSVCQFVNFTSKFCIKPWLIIPPAYEVCHGGIMFSSFLCVCVCVCVCVC